jgi:DNA polymerase-3 subunit gamma/tau
MSLALARKYRPRRFAEVAVQTHVATTLRSAVEHDRVANAYLFCGPRGTGKTTLARVLAMSLNCEKRRPDREPCGECLSCQRIWSGAASLDVVEIDAASNRGVDDARDLRERAMYAPTGDDRYKVYIIDEAHMLTKEAWNALLKIIEEPPPRVVFVFATTEPQRIANTAAPILSRVQRFDLRRMAPADVRARLEAVLQSEQVRAEPEALTMLARAADGSMRDALSLTDQVLSLGTGAVTAELVRETLGLVHDDEILGLLDAVAAHRAADIFPAVARLADQGADFTLLFAGVLDALRAELALVLGAEVPDLSERMRDALAAAKGRFAAGDLLRMLNLAVELEPHFRRSAQQQLLFEMLLVRFALLDRTVDIESVIRGVAAGGGGGASVFERPRDPSADRPHPPLGRPRDPSASQPQPPLERPRTRDAERRGPPPRMHDVRRVAEAPSPAATLADAPQPDDVPPQPLDINRLAARWDDVVEAVRLAGRGLVASALAESTPTSVAGGVVTVQVTSDALGAAIEGGAEAILAALHTMFTGVTRLVTARAEGTPAPARRMTESEAIANRVARLRKEAPLLDAAFDVLDLRLIE